jgi:Domain of unknown function (DUF6249)
MDASLVQKILGLLIPLAAIAFPLVVVFLVLHYRERDRQQLHDTLKHYADRGMPVPRELIDPPRRPRSALMRPRFWALTLIGAGIGLALLFVTLDLPEVTGVGALLVCVGVAQLIALALDARDNARLPPPAADTQPPRA